MSRTSLRTQAIILKRINYREADRILTILTPEGVYSVIARGVRKEKSKLAGSIELFSVSDVTLHKGKGNLYTLTSGRLVKHYANIVKQYEITMWLYIVLRHIQRAAADNDETGWFDVMRQLFEACDKSHKFSVIQTWFYIRYAELSGEGLSVYRDVEGDVMSVEGRYSYDIMQKGLRRIESVDGIGAEHIKVMRIMAAKPLEVIMQVGGIEPFIDRCLQISRQHAAIE